MLVPVQFDGGEDLGEPVTGQVDQALVIAQVKEIDELGAAWRLADASEP